MTPFAEPTFVYLDVEYGHRVYKVCLYRATVHVMWVKRPGLNGKPHLNFVYDLTKPTGKAVAAKAIKQFKENSNGHLDDR